MPEKKKKPWYKRLLSVLFFLVFNPVTAIVIAAAIILPTLPLDELKRDKEIQETLAQESVFDNYFVAALGDKYERLHSVKEPKLVVVGGSSVAFGLDSELLGRYTGREVVNFGLYATLGSKVMLDLSEDGLVAGDIVVFAPEPEAGTMSLFFGAEAVWQAIDVYPALFDLIPEGDKEKLYAEFADYKDDKDKYSAGVIPNPPGVYNRKSFNEFGDIAVERPYNLMAKGYDSNTTFSFDTGIISDDFIDYFNAYATRLAEKGVTVYFSFCPINELALEEGVDGERLSAYQSYLDERLVCPIISDIEDYVMEWGYFYDTNMHLNDAGVTVRTNMLIKDVLRAEGVNDYLALENPAAPGKESGNEFIGGDNTYLDYFILQPTELGDGLEIVGVTDLARENTDSEIVIPYHNGEKMIVSIAADVLGEIPNLVGVRFGENMASIADGVFRGCDELKYIIIDFEPTKCSVSIPNDGNPDGFLLDCPNEIQIKATKDEEFQGHYTWGWYYDLFVKEITNG